MSYSISTRYQVADPSALIEKAPEIREKAIAAGAEGAALIQPIAAGPHVDVMVALTVWNSVDAGIEGTGKRYADPSVRHCVGEGRDWPLRRGQGTVLVRFINFIIVVALPHPVQKVSPSNA